MLDSELVPEGGGSGPGTDNFDDNGSGDGGGGGRPSTLVGVADLVWGSWPRKFHRWVKSPNDGGLWCCVTRCRCVCGDGGLSAGLNAISRLITGDKSNPVSMNQVCGGVNVGKNRLQSNR